MTSQKCNCSCSHTAFEVHGKPMFRAICHCTICQKFNQAPFADILVFSPTQIEVPSQEFVHFDTYKPPPNVQRGKCRSCEKAAIEVFSAPLMPKMVMVPAAMFGNDAKLPEPVAHLFYEKRVADAQDTYPKYNGFMPSQLIFFKHFLATKFFGNKNSKNT